jgi:hypothetical protein
MKPSRKSDERKRQSWELAASHCRLHKHRWHTLPLNMEHMGLGLDTENNWVGNRTRRSSNTNIEGSWLPLEPLDIPSKRKLVRTAKLGDEQAQRSHHRPKE